MSEFLSPTWIGVYVGIAALVLTWRARKRNIIALQSVEMALVGDDAIFPDIFQVHYRGDRVTILTLSTIWIWNAGKTILRKSDVVPHDPLRIHFAGEVLGVRIKKVSREAIGITTGTLDHESGSVYWGFEFMESGDGCVLEVLHSGPTEAPECTGTIVGLQQGIQYRPRYHTSRWKTRFLLIKWLPVAVVLTLLSLVMTIHGVLGLFGASDQLDRPGVGAVVFGLLTLYGIRYLWLLWKLRVSLTAPSSLDS